LVHNPRLALFRLAALCPSKEARRIHPAIPFLNSANLLFLIAKNRISPTERKTRFSGQSLATLGAPLVDIYASMVMRVGCFAVSLGSMNQ
jgi:hypothetical protein